MMSGSEVPPRLPASISEADEKLSASAAVARGGLTLMRISVSEVASKLKWQAPEVALAPR